MERECRNVIKVELLYLLVLDFTALPNKVVYEYILYIIPAVTDIGYLLIFVALHDSM